METELVIRSLKDDEISFPPLSARGCVQKLWTIGEANYRRTVDGNLIFTGTHLKKYRTKIEGSDKNAFTTNFFFTPGTKVVVDCIQRLWQVVLPDSSSVKTNSPYVENSIVFQDKFEVDTKKASGTINFTPVSYKRFISYRPRLNMMILKYEMNMHEWDFKSKWSIEMEED